MNEINKDFRKYLLNFDEFKDLCEYFISKAASKSGDDDITNKTFYEIVKAVSLEVAENINNSCESPIEKMLLNALLLGSIKNDALGIILFQTYDDAQEEINSLIKEIKNLREFIAWSDKKGFDDKERVDFLNSELIKNKISKEEVAHIKSLTARYHYLELDNKFHMCLQPKLYKLIENKKYIRPDFLSQHNQKLKLL